MGLPKLTSVCTSSRECIRDKGLLPTPRYCWNGFDAGLDEEVATDCAGQRTFWTGILCPEHAVIGTSCLRAKQRLRNIAAKTFFMHAPYLKVDPTTCQLGAGTWNAWLCSRMRYDCYSCPPGGS